MWERFSYYGMRALLLLYMTAPVAAGGLGFDAAQGGAIYGMYTAMVYMACLPGGWIADRLIGQRRAVLVDELYRMKNRQRDSFLGEQVLTDALLDVSSSERKRIYFLVGHGELQPGDPDGK